MILLGRDVYTADSAAIKVLPKNAFNCYFPLPFRALRIELENLGPRGMTIWFMADWQLFPEGSALTPLRLHAVHRREAPAERFGSIPMADLEGRGFVAGMAQAIEVQDDGDAWYHTGGDTFLLDGETAPKILAPDEWKIAGPFECETHEDFSRREWAEDPMET